ncbi:hypothetical protein L484_018946 [Morus notabilis]|uniref:Protein SIEVE ELEMENT OCCLUSION B n=1 Tax=Morus notabilis TaxID=981085 RepID=W9RJW4_9ROSA|nr:protein SIEVE ELEMENT OCCLUSION B [Morus notabilis]EXB94445.1 hypothetical protein L484_018946 [Morus notabilis]
MATNFQQALVPHPAKRDPMQRRFNQSDDNMLVKQIRETHNAESHYLVDVRPVLHVIEDILRRAAPGIDGIINGTHDALLDDKAVVATFDDMLDGLCQIIHKISCEMFCKCSGGDLHGSTLALFKMLSNYPWEAKVVLTLAGFSTTYGEFWLVAQLCTTTPLAKAVAHLKQVSDILENSQALKPQLEAINKLLNAVVNVTKRIIEFNELPTEYLPHDSPQVAVVRAHIPSAAYWTIRSVVACAWQVASFTDIRYEHMSSTSEIWELSSSAHKLKNIHDLLAAELDGCRKFIEERRYEEEYRNLIRLLEIAHLDNMKVLKALISTRDDQPLVFGNPKARVSIDGLRRKHVLLLISDLDLSHEEIAILYSTYDMRLKHDGMYDVHVKGASYELVWIPIVDRIVSWDEGHQKKFSDLLTLMPWHSVHSPQIIEPPVVKYIREKWNFDKKLILVSLDPQGKVSSRNAAHMMWIWGNAAFPFSDGKEEALWDAESWTLKLLVDGIDAEILQWIAQGKYICLYGGDDINWIREFTSRAKVVAQALGIQLEMIYVGKSNVPKERLRKINSTIETEGLSQIWPEMTSIWFFWSRLESMRCSKARYGKTIEADPVLKEIMTLLSYDGSDQGWVSVWRGQSEMARANGQLALQTLKEFQQWETQAKQMGLIPAYDEELKKRHSPQHCTRLILPGLGQDIPQKVVCTECGREMEKFFMFRCCTD